MPLCPFPLKKERELCKINGKVKAHTSRAYPGFISMKHLKYCYSPLDGMLVHYRVTAQQYVAGAVVPFVNGRCHL